jgi:hypothetical protein
MLSDLQAEDRLPRSPHRPHRAHRAAAYPSATLSAKASSRASTALLERGRRED